MLVEKTIELVGHIVSFVERTGTVPCCSNILFMSFAERIRCCSGGASVVHTHSLKDLSESLMLYAKRLVFLPTLSLELAAAAVAQQLAEVGWVEVIVPVSQMKGLQIVELACYLSSYEQSETGVLRVD